MGFGRFFSQGRGSSDEISINQLRNYEKNIFLLKTEYCSKI